MAQQQYDLNKAAELQYGELPKLQKQLEIEEEKVKNEDLSLVHESVTDEEIQEWLTELRTMLENDTTGVYQAALDGFDSEEAYWAYEYEVYRVDLPIQNYVSSLQQGVNVISEHGNYNSDTEAFNEMKHQLADEQDYKIVN